MEDGPSLLTELDLNLENGDDISKAIESLAVINIGTQSSLGKSMLFCGLRSGILLSFGMTVDNDNSSLSISKLNQALQVSLFYMF